MPEKGLTSFVVIAYNEEANIAGTISAIKALDGLGKHEIIIVDDGSRDGTAGIVKGMAEADAGIRLIELGNNRGRGSARASGIARARGEYVATVDADIILPADWLVRTRSALGNHDAVGGTAVPDGDVAYLYRRFRLTPRAVGHTATVTGSNGLYRRRVFELAGFDAALREGEDVAFNHAMRRNGLSAATVPGLLVRHQEAKPFGASLRWLFQTGRGATRQLIAYREIRQPDLVTGGFVASAALGLLAIVRRRRLAGAALPVGFVVAASVQHVRSRFKTPVADWPRLAPAVVVDCALLTAYFLGRLAGLSRSGLRQRESVMQNRLARAGLPAGRARGVDPPWR